MEQYKAGIKEKLIKAGMVSGQPRLSQAHSNRSTTQPGPNAAAAQGQPHPHAAARSMSGPAAYSFGNMPAMGSLGDQLQMPPHMAPMGGLGYDFPFQHQQQMAQERPQSLHHPSQQQRNARYGPYPSPHALGAYGHNTLPAQQQSSHTPHSSAVMGVDYDYFSGNNGGFQMASGSDVTQQQIAMQRRASLAVPPSYSRSAHLGRSQQVYAQQHSQSYGMQGLERDQDSSSSSLTGTVPVSYNYF